MRKPALSVLMPVYNAEKYISAAIGSVLAQDFQDFRFVIVDDGSTDSSVSILQHYALKDQRITVLSKTNTGLVSTLNYGLRHNTAEFIARMDADDVALPNRFSMQLAALRSSSKLAAVGSRVACIDAAGSLRRTRPVVTTPAEIAATLPIRNCMNHPSMMIRSSALAEVGSYRERFKRSEDYDLWLRLIEKHQLANLPDVLLKYRTHDDQISSARNRKHSTIYSVVAAADFFSRKYGLPTSDSPIDTDDPTRVADQLKMLLSYAEEERDKRALYRHCLRFIRVIEAEASGDLIQIVWRLLLARGEYWLLAKLVAYTGLSPRVLRRAIK